MDVRPPTDEEINNYLRRHPEKLPRPSPPRSLIVAGASALAVAAGFGFFSSQIIEYTSSYRRVPIERLTAAQYADSLDRCAMRFMSKRRRDVPAYARVLPKYPDQIFADRDPLIYRVLLENPLTYRIVFHGRGAALATGDNAYIEDIQIVVLIIRNFDDPTKIEAEVFLTDALQTPWTEGSPEPNFSMFKPFEPTQRPKLDVFLSEVASEISRCVGLN